MATSSYLRAVLLASRRNMTTSAPHSWTTALRTCQLGTTRNNSRPPPRHGISAKRRETDSHLAQLMEPGQRTPVSYAYHPRAGLTPRKTLSAAQKPVDASLPYTCGSKRLITKAIRLQRLSPTIESAMHSSILVHLTQSLWRRGRARAYHITQPTPASTVVGLGSHLKACPSPEDRRIPSRAHSSDSRLPETPPLQRPASLDSHAAVRDRRTSSLLPFLPPKKKGPPAPIRPAACASEVKLPPREARSVLKEAIVCE